MISEQLGTANGEGESMARDYSRRWFVSRLGLLGCTLPLTTSTQHHRALRVGHIGFLGGGSPTLVEAFEQEMRRLRYVEGENIVNEKRVLRPNSSDLAAQAAELAHMNLDLIVVALGPCFAAVARRDGRPCIAVIYRSKAATRAEPSRHNNSGPERRKRVSHQTWCGEGWLVPRRPVNCDVRHLPPVNGRR
jgi:hypothetical protein